MKYPRTAISILCSLLVLATACLSPRSQKILAAAAPLVVSLAELGETTGKLPPGSTVAIHNGTAVIISAGSTQEKVMQLKQLGLQAAVTEGALKEGDALIVDKAGTSLVQIIDAASAKLNEPEQPSPTIHNSSPPPPCH